MILRQYCLTMPHLITDKEKEYKPQTAEEILGEGEEEDIGDAKLLGDIAQYKSQIFWETETNPAGIINAHLLELQGENKHTGVWKIMADAFPQSIGMYGDEVPFEKARNNYINSLHPNPIPDDIQKIFIKIDEMNDALRMGKKFKKKSQKAEEVLE